MSNHTPGPWKAATAFSENEPNGYHVISPPKWGSPDIAIADSDANARLIAAAPELLAACQFLADAAETEPGMSIYRAHIEQARAAIAKAEGKYPQTQGE
jgi:hypothetical protein